MKHQHFPQGTAKVPTVDLTNDVDCPICHTTLAIETDGHGGIVGVEYPRRVVHRHPVTPLDSAVSTDTREQG